MNHKTIHLSGLNGLRAIAALGVVISHITFKLNSFQLDPYILGSSQDGQPEGLDLAGFSVSIFFALSGFLITYLLQTEKETGKINVNKFYIRRILRIWPLYYLYLLITLLTIIAFGFEFNFNSLFLYLFYAANIPFVLNTTLPFLGHYWSLGVEEQFYLFWPWLNKMIDTKLVFLIILLVAVLIGTKLFFHFFYPSSIIEEIIHVTRFHCMIIGALGAILYKKKNESFLKMTDNKISQCISLFIILLIGVNKFHIASVIDQEIISGVTVFLIIGQINIKNRILNLDAEVFDFIGKISYGIYVFHPLIIFSLTPVLNYIYVQDIYKYFIVYLSVLGSTILIAFFSYKYFETYFLKLKENFSVINSSDTKHYTKSVHVSGRN